MQPLLFCKHLYELSQGFFCQFLRNQNALLSVELRCMHVLNVEKNKVLAKLK